MIIFRFSFLILSALFLLSGCASFSLFGKVPVVEKYVACPVDSVWEKALDSLKAYPVTTKDKEKGIIETSWKEIPVQGRPYGIFGRQGLGDKERSRLTLTMKPVDQNVTTITLTEQRQHWGFRGGAQIYKWFPVEPSQEALDGVMNAFTTQLDKEGCLVES